MLFRLYYGKVMTSDVYILLTPIFTRQVMRWSRGYCGGYLKMVQVRDLAGISSVILIRYMFHVIGFTLYFANLINDVGSIYSVIIFKKIGFHDIGTYENLFNFLMRIFYISQTYKYTTFISAFETFRVT